MKSTPGPVTIAGVAPSSEIRRQLVEADEPVLLAFSRGKDSIAAWLALLDSGMNPDRIVPYHMYLVPHLRFVDESLAYFEQWFGRPIINLPHPSLYRWLNSAVFQAPENLAIIEAAQLPEPTYDQMVQMIREDIGATSAWVADGVRAADSPIRRLSIATHGAMKPSSRKVSVVWDWRIAGLRDAIASHAIELPPEYEWFGRSFDGIDYRFLEPMSRFAPDDYARVLEWFPQAELEMVRHGIR